MCNVFWTALQMNDTNLLLCHSGAVVVIEGNLLNSGKLGKSCITDTCTSKTYVRRNTYIHKLVEDMIQKKKSLALQTFSSDFAK